MTREEVNKEISLLQEKDRNNGGVTDDEFLRFMILMLLWLEFEENKNAPVPILNSKQVEFAESYARQIMENNERQPS